MRTRAEINRQNPPAERYINGRRIRAHAYVDENNLVYDLKPRGRLGSIVLWALSLAPLSILAWLLLPGLLGTPQAMIAPLPTAGLAQTSLPRPTYVPAPGGASAPQGSTDGEPRPTDTPIAVPPPPTVPTPTWAFWSDADLAAFTATAEAFYTPETIPTAPPAFVDATLAACADQALVAQSPVLQLWCPSAVNQEGGE